MTKRSPTARPYADRIPRIPVGPLAPVVLKECSEWLTAQGYSPGSAAGIVNLLGRLSMWMRDVAAGVEDIDENLLARFVAAERSRELVCLTVQNSMGTMRRFLTAGGYLRVAEGEAGPATPTQAAVTQWRWWMRDQRELSDKTIDARCYYAAELLDVITASDGAVEWGGLDAAVVNKYVTERGRPYSVVTRAHIVDAVRCLLRWALSTEQLDRDFTAGILKSPETRRALPRGVSADQVAGLLAVCDPTTAIGARDRAVVMVLVRPGLRAGEAAALRLEDIDWAGRAYKGHRQRTRAHAANTDRCGPSPHGVAETSTTRSRPGRVRADQSTTPNDDAPRTLGDYRPAV